MNPLPLKRRRFASLAWSGSWTDGHLATIVVAACYALISIPAALSLNIWIDEGYTLHTTGSSIAYAIRESIGFEDQPPLYFILLTLWRHFDGSDFFARSFSIASVIATLFVVADFVRRRLPTVPVVVAVAMIAINPFAVWAGTEARLYAFALLLASLVISTFFDAFVSDEHRRSPAFFAIVAIAALYTQYYLGFLLLACGIVLVAQRRWPDLRRYAIVCIAIAIAFAPMPSIVVAQIHAAKAGSSFRLPLGSAIREVAATVLNFVLPHAWIRESTHAAILNALYVAACAAGAAAIVVRTRLRFDAMTRVFFIMATTTAAFYLLVNLVVHEQIAQRYLVAAYIPANLAALSLCGSLLPKARGRVAIALLAFALSLDAVGAIRLYPYHAKTGDWKRVTSYLGERVGPAEPIAFFHQEDAFMFAHYFRGKNKLVPIPRPLDFVHYDTGAFTLHQERDVAQALGSAAEARTIWLVHVNPCRFQYWELGCNYLDSYVASHYRITETKTFYGTKILHLERSATANR